MSDYTEVFDPSLSMESASVQFPLIDFTRLRQAVADHDHGKIGDRSVVEILRQVIKDAN